MQLFGLKMVNSENPYEEDFIGKQAMDLILFCSSAVDHFDVDLYVFCQPPIPCPVASSSTDPIHYC